MSVSDFSALAEPICDSSFDASLCPKVMAVAADYLKCGTARLFLFDNDPQANGFGASVGIDRSFYEKYDAYPETLNSIKYGFVAAHLDDPLTIDEILGAYGGRDVNGNEAFDHRHYKKRMVPLGYQDVLAALTVKNGRSFGGLAVTRRLEQSLQKPPHAAIFFHDPDRRFEPPGEAMAKPYSLTGAELRLLLALAHGATLSEIAGKSGAALAAVRSHLKNLVHQDGKITTVRTCAAGHDGRVANQVRARRGMRHDSI
jgi:DNA-binding CsgD family transcriptional regulator